MKRFLLAGWLLLFSLLGQGQSIPLTNPSFEDLPVPGRAPRGWTDCGQAGESPVDVHPAGSFGVTKPPADGHSYIGMVTRDNGTWESISQPLPSPLRAGECYLFAFYAARSEQYMSVSRTTNEPANFEAPALVRVWGADSARCNRAQLLAYTPPVTQTNWRLYPFILQPEIDCRFLIFEAYFADSTGNYANSNVLIDFLQPIRPRPCDSTTQEIDPLTLIPTPAERGLPVAATLPETAEELAGWIRRFGAEVRFLATQPTLERWIYLDAGQKVVHRNYYLALLAAAMAKYPEQTLYIGINEQEHLADAAQLENELRSELKLIDAPNNIILRKMRRRDFKREWLADNRLLFFKFAE